MITSGRKIYNQIGTSGLRRYGNDVYEEFLPELRWPRAAKVYQEMSDNDAVIGAILYLAEMLIRGATWSVEAGGETENDKQAADFVKSCMDDMDMSWANVISEILSMLTYGFSFHEIVYKVRRGPSETNKKYKSKYSDGRIGWRKIPIRSQASLWGWEFDENGEATAFIQWAEPDYKRVTIPLHKGLLFRTRVSRGNPEGKSLLRNAYRSYFYKKHFEDIEGIGIERDLAGFPVLKAPADLDLWDEKNEEMVALRIKAEELVASVRRDSEEGILLPAGWDLSLLTTGSSRQIDIGATIERYDKRIATTMLSDLVLLGERAGSYALASTKQSTLATALQSQLCNISDVFNADAIPKLLSYNDFGELTSYPKIVPGQIQMPSLKEMALMLRAMGLKIGGDIDLMNYLRKITGMPELTEDTFNEVYKVQAPNNAHAASVNDAVIEIKEPPSELDPEVDDEIQNIFEQNDENYTGGTM